MEFSLVSSEKLKVTLSPDDLLRLGLRYEEIDYQDEKTRKALVDLLAEGRASAGFQPRGAKLYIEVFPSAEGGCVICYTRLAGGETFARGRLLAGPPPIVFAFSDPDALLRAGALTARLYRQRILASTLYAFGREYRLIIHPLDIGDHLSASFLGEYGRLVGTGNLLAAYIEEHGKLLRQTDALEALATVEEAGL